MLALAWFAAVALPILLIARVSGAHLNPAVSLAAAGAGQLPSGELLPYVASQFVGALVGSGAVWVVLGPGAHLGATVPAGGAVGLVPPLEGAFTAALILSALVLGSARGVVPAWASVLPAVVVGLATFLIGPWTGSSLNPARSIAPAVLSGDYLGLWAYLVVQTAAALAMGWLWRHRASASLAPVGISPSDAAGPLPTDPRPRGVK